jgi:hypothetical protein
MTDEFSGLKKYEYIHLPDRALCMHETAAMDN